MDQPPTGRTFVSPNTGPQLFCLGLQALAEQVCSSATNRDVDAWNALAIIGAVAAIEAFANCYFRIIAEERDDEALRRLVAKGAPKAKGKRELSEKISACCVRAFGRDVDRESDAWHALDDLIERRNSLVHFKSTHSTVGSDTFPELANVTFHGLAEFASLTGATRSTPSDLLRLVVQVVVLVADAKRLDHAQKCGMVHLWTGTLLGGVEA